jgi:hypothetical protein
VTFASRPAKLAGRMMLGFDRTPADVGANASTLPTAKGKGYIVHAKLWCVWVMRCIAKITAQVSSLHRGLKTSRFRASSPPVLLFLLNCGVPPPLKSRLNSSLAGWTFLKVSKRLPSSMHDVGSWPGSPLRDDLGRASKRPGRKTSKRGALNS